MTDMRDSVVLGVGSTSPLAFEYVLYFVSTHLYCFVVLSYGIFHEKYRLNSDVLLRFYWYHRLTDWRKELDRRGRWRGVLKVVVLMSESSPFCWKGAGHGSAS